MTTDETNGEAVEEEAPPDTFEDTLWPEVNTSARSMLAVVMSTAVESLIASVWLMALSVPAMVVVPVPAPWMKLCTVIAAEAEAKRVAEEQGIPLYQVFTNAQLGAMILGRMREVKEIGTVAGVGESRVQQFGSAFAELLQSLHPVEKAEAE